MCPGYCFVLFSFSFFYIKGVSLENGSPKPPEILHIQQQSET